MNQDRLIDCERITEAPELPAFPLSGVERGRLFEILAGYNQEPLPEWAFRLHLARLVQVPPWELHRCPPEWLDAALEMERIEREVEEFHAAQARMKRRG